MMSKDFAIIVVDQQFDFEPGGALPVMGGDEIAAPIAKLMERFENVVITQDSHPKGHISFASSYEGKKPYELLKIEEVLCGTIRSEFSQETLVNYLQQVPGKQQVLWPDHCVTGSKGWEINPKISTERASLVLRKGTKLTCDSYSAFFENDGSSTGLSGFLRARAIQKLVIVGLAGDYCVLWSIKDAIREGFQVYFDERLTRFVNYPQGSRETALAEIRNLGAIVGDIPAH